MHLALAPCSKRPVRPAHPRATLLAIGSALLLSISWMRAAEPISKKQFDIPADAAARSLKRFSEQANLQVIFASDVASGIRTRATKGEMTPREALESMLVDTGLVLIQDDKIGAFSVRKETADERSKRQEAQPTANAPRDEQKKKSTETSQTQEPMKRTRLLTKLGASLALWIAPAEGQTTSTSGGSAKPTAENKDEAIELSPFVVSTDRDVGYLAQNSLSGTRLNTDLKDVGSPISTYTQEFIRDIATTDTDELAKYMISVEYEPVEAGGNQLENTRNRPVKIRGLDVKNNSINFFTSGMPQDNFNTERIDLTRGANSILFGIGSPGGMLNVTTKRARFGRDAVETTLQARSENGWRGELDINKEILPNRLALRVVGMGEDRPGWRNYEYKKAERLYITSKLRITKATELNMEWEQGNVEQIRARTYTLEDNCSSWLNAGGIVGSTVNAAEGRAALGATYIVYDTTSGQLMNWGGLATSAGPTSAGSRPEITDFNFLPKEVVVAGPGFEAGNDYSRFQAFLTHAFTPNLNLELAYSHTSTVSFATRAQGDYTDLRIDPNPRLPNGAPNPNVGRFYVDGFPFLFDRDETDDGARLTLSYQTDLGKFFGKHRLAGLWGGDRNELISRGNPREQIVVNPFNTSSIINGSNRIFRRTYLDLTGPSSNIVAGNPRTQPVSGLIVSGGRSAGGHVLGQPIQTEYVDSATGAGVNDVDKIRTFMGVVQSTFLNDRLVLIYGHRRDTQDHWNSVGAQGGPEGPFRLGRIVYTRAADPERAIATNQTKTAVFHAFPWLSFTYNNSRNTGLQSQGGQPTESRRGPRPQGVSQDYGIKLDLFNRKLFLTALYFESAGTNNLVAGGGISSSRINDIWTNLDLAGALTANGRTREGSLTTGSGYVSDDSASGYEVELLANPLPNWRILMNWSNSRAVRTNIGEEWRSYIAANRDFWLQGTNPRVLLDGSGLLAPVADNHDSNIETVGETVALLDQRIFSELIVPDGELARGQSRNRVNLRTNYSFKEGSLKGLSLGGGVRYRDPVVINSFFEIPASGLKSDAVQTNFYSRSDLQVDFNVGYEGRQLKILGKKVRWSLQLNINNLLNETEIIATRSSNTGAPPPLQYRLVDPREFILTSRFRF